MLEIFERFVELSPLTIMVRAILELSLSPDKLNELFDEAAEKQYTRTLLFSDVVELLCLVVCGIFPSPNAAYKAMSKKLQVSKPAFYSKLNGLEPQIGQALVRHIAESLTAVIENLGTQLPELLPGFRVKIVDGNHLGSTQHRLKPLQSIGAAPLPGQTLTVLDAQLMLAVDVFPCEDAYTQERIILQQVLETVSANEVWIADRNFCTRRCLFEIAQKQAYFVIREHKNLPFTALDQLSLMGPSPTGDIYEQPVEIEYEGKTLKVRRVVVKLDTPTRHGDTEVALLTNLEKEVASALKVAELYQERWTVEGLFQVVTDVFHCEIKTLGYPQAALFSFCMALFAFNVFAVLKAALGAVHGAGKIEAGISNFYLVEEVKRVYSGMMIALPPSEWEYLGELSLEQFCLLLKEWAANVKLENFTSSPRGKKKKRPPRVFNPKQPHVSTSRVLADKFQ